MRKAFFLLIVSIVIWMGSCVEPVEFVAGNNKEILIVDGIISDRNIEQFISLKKAFVYENTNVFRGITGAALKVIENGTTEYICREKDKDAGVYYLPDGFIGKVNNTYQLKIKLATGEEYQSTEETMNSVPDIDRIYAEYKDSEVDWKGTKVDGHFIYIDASDFPDKEDYYSWSWKLSEKQEYCKTCAGGMYFPDDPATGFTAKCVDYPQLQRAGIIYDYVCNSKCYEIYYAEKFNVMSDVFSTGNKITGRKVAEIPYFQRNGAVVEIYQHSLTSSAFRFLKLMIDQTQNTGTLAETPPAALVGNIRNVNDKFENIGGYFMASSYKIKQFWLERKDYDAYNPFAIGMFEGRWVSPEPPDPDAKPPRPPLAPCVPSKNRTPIKPDGWKD